MKHLLTPEQSRKLDEWLKEIKPKIFEIMKEKGVENPFESLGIPYYGCFGGGLTYLITPMTIGTSILVKEHWTQETLDL